MSTGSGTAPLLSPVDVERLGSLYLTARMLVEGLYHGSHAAPGRGSSTEFYDYRMYSPGDEAARIDWKVFARTDRLYVRRRRRFADLTVQLAVDASASMNFAGIDRDRAATSHPAPTKYRVASELAAAMAFLAVKQGDRAGLTVFADRIIEATPTAGTWENLQRIINVLEVMKPAGPTRFGECLGEAAGRWGRRRAMVVIVSDFLSEVGETLGAVHRLRHDGHDVVAIQVLTGDEIDPGLRGPAVTVDPESGGRLRTDFAVVREEYVRRVAEHVDELHRGLIACGAEHRLVRTDEPRMKSLREILAARAMSAS